MRQNSVPVLVIALLLGGVAAFLARSWLQARIPTEQHLGTIVAAATALPFGTQLTERNVKEIPWAANSFPSGGFGTKAELFKEGGRISLASIQNGEPILASKITGPGQRASLSTLLSADKRAITIRVDDVRGVAGFILPNDRVDVVLIRSEADSSGRKDYSDLLLQDVKVIGIDQIVSEQKEKPVVAKAVTLEVTPKQAQKISLASEIGRLSLILRKAGDSDTVASERVTQSDLIEGEAIPQHQASAIPVAIKSEPAPVLPAAPPPSSEVTVTIIRDLKSQDYKVHKEVR